MEEENVFCARVCVWGCVEGRYGGWEYRIR